MQQIDIKFIPIHKKYVRDNVSGILDMVGQENNSTESKLFSYTKRCVMSRRIPWCHFENKRPFIFSIGVIKSSLSQDLGQRLFHVRELVLPYINLHDSVELFSCPTISKIPETLSLTYFLWIGINLIFICCISLSIWLLLQCILIFSHVSMYSLFRLSTYQFFRHFIVHFIECVSFSFSHFLFLRHRIMCWPRPLPKG